jgi:hypothetical protein
MFDDPAILLCGPVMCHVAAGQPAAAAPRSLPQPVQSAAGTPRPTSTTAGTAQPVVGAAQKPPHAARAAPATAAAGPSTAAGHASQFDVTYQRRPPTAGCPSSTSRALWCCLRTPTRPVVIHGPQPTSRVSGTIGSLQPPAPPPYPMQGPPPPVRLFRPRGPRPPPPPSSHPMLTRGRAAALGIAPELHVASLPPASTSASPIPTNYRSALADANWRAAMVDEYEALRANDTWRLVPRPPDANIVTGKWIFRHKFHADGSLARHKARWVVRSFSQQHGIDYDETFSPVVKQTTIRVVLNIAISHGWPIHQLDVKDAFLHSHLDETVYCQQPSGFVDPSAPDHVWLLQKSLYGLKQAPRTWYQRFATYIRHLDFVPAVSDTSLFVYKEGTATTYLLLYVDDIVLTASSSMLLQAIMGRLHSEFAMTDLGALHHFLGISVSCSSNGLFLSQRQYAQDLLQRAGMAKCHSTTTPLDTCAKLSASDGTPVANASLYRSLAGALQYLTLTSPNLAYAVQQVCLFMHDPCETHLAQIKRILRYMKGILSLRLHIGTSPVDSLTSYSNADWGGCPDSRRSTSGYCIYLGDNLVSWSSKR